MKPNHPKATNGVKKSTYKFTHCNQTSHTKNGCFELVEYPEWWDYSRDPQNWNSNEISTTKIVERKTKDEVVEKALALVVVTNNNNKALNMSTISFNYAWIIDYGAIHDKIFDFR